jgi:dihydroneopterin aldolase
LDNVFIEGLEVDTVIGVYDWEREIRQCLRLDLTLRWDIRPAAAQDALTLTLDYAAVAQRIQQFAAEARFQLVETFAERLAQLLQDEFAISWLRLRVTKPGAVPAARGVGVEIERP